MSYARTCKKKGVVSIVSFAFQGLQYGKVTKKKKQTQFNCDFGFFVNSLDDQGKWHHRGRQKSNKSVINSRYIVNDTHLTILTSYLTFEKYSTQFWGLFMCGIPGQRLLSEKINLFTLFFNIRYNMICVRDSFFFVWIFFSNLVYTHNNISHSICFQMITMQISYYIHLI